jgi:hypothetical protein
MVCKGLVKLGLSDGNAQAACFGALQGFVDQLGLRHAQRLARWTRPASSASAARVNVVIADRHIVNEDGCVDRLRCSRSARYVY